LKGLHDNFDSFNEYLLHLNYFICREGYIFMLECAVSDTIPSIVTKPHMIGSHACKINYTHGTCSTLVLFKLFR